MDAGLASISKNQQGKCHGEAPQLWRKDRFAHALALVPDDDCHAGDALEAAR
jgi:hypothetical protein